MATIPKDPVSVPVETFTSLMSDMRSHYLTGTTVPFALATHPGMMQLLASTANLSGDGVERLSDAVDPVAEVKATAQASTKTSFDNQKTGAQTAATAAKASKDAAAFKATMAAQQKQAIADSTATINTAYAAATAAGVANPAQMSAIASGMKDLSDTLNGVLGGLTTAISTIMSAISNIINDVLDPLLAVAGAFAPVIEDFSFL